MSGVDPARHILLDIDEELRRRHGEISVFTDASLVFFQEEEKDGEGGGK